MSKKNVNDELNYLISPVAEMWKKNSDEPYDNAIQEWEYILQAKNTKEIHSSVINKSIFWIFLNFLILRPLNFILIFFNDIFAHNLFEERTIKVLSKFDLIHFKTDGKIILDPAPINPALGKFLISLLSIFTGLWIGWIFFSDSFTVTTIFNSFFVGIILGTLISIISDLSYDHNETLKKLKPFNLNSLLSS